MNELDMPLLLQNRVIMVEYAKLKEASSEALELCYAIEKLPPSEEATRLSVMASNLRMKLDGFEIPLVYGT